MARLTPTAIPINAFHLKDHGPSTTWVSASAGSGKTKILVDRILGLLLKGVPYHRILCLTFTKAAASEMQRRLDNILSKWAIEPDDQRLIQWIQEHVSVLSGIDYPPAPDFIRSLYFEMMEASPPLRIETLHAFCQRLLKMFPLEAGLPPFFQVLEEFQSRALLRETVRNILAFPDQNIQRHAVLILEYLHESQWVDFFFELAQQCQIYSPDSSTDMLSTWLGIPDGLSEEDYIQSFVMHLPWSLTESDRWMDVLRQMGGPSDLSNFDVWQGWLMGDAATRTRLLDDYIALFLTQDHTPRKRIVSKALQTAMGPSWIEALASEAQRVEEFVKTRSCLRILGCSQSVLAVLEAIRQAYANTKWEQGVVDFQDLMTAVRHLLADPNVAPDVLYRLDGGIDHILIDEAQDTSIQQWGIIQSITSDFFISSRFSQKIPKTLFVVGDFKQSIYSFQGADPREFSKMRQYFLSQHQHEGSLFQDQYLDRSYRSQLAILKAVDAVFNQLHAADGVIDFHTDDLKSSSLQQVFSQKPIKSIHHQVWREDGPGHVECWPLLQPGSPRADLVWKPPVEQILAPSSEFSMAQCVADRIIRWMNEDSIQPRDVLILVRKRGALSRNILRVLEQLHIPVMGRDRFKILDDLVVQDLLALAQFAILPHDDFNLAIVLKTPLLGWNDDDLFKLCYQHQADHLSPSLPSRLWDQLLQPQYHKTRIYLERLLSWAQESGPHLFFERILCEPCPNGLVGKEQWLKTLGSAIQDVVNEFLLLVADYQTQHPWGLQHFMAWIQKSDIEMKRHIDDAEHNQVRLMTVHGSKGLQSKAVILPDTTQYPRHTLSYFWIPTTHTRSSAHHSLGEDRSSGGYNIVWFPKKDMRIPKIQTMMEAEKRRMDQEYRRLLYVAMTRAEDRLTVFGLGNAGETSPVPGSWYMLIQQGIKTIPHQRVDVPQSISHHFHPDEKILTL